MERDQAPVQHEPVDKPSSAESVGVDIDTRIAELKRELQASEDYLQTANEELSSSNEELQSVNEELARLNAELQTKVLDLSRANNDMNNLLAGTGIATVFVDHQLRVLRFTPAATSTIKLTPSDIGQPVSDIASHLAGYDSLEADTRTVLDTLAPKEIEVRSTEGRWYLMRILPYRTMDNVIDGAVLTFVDITTARKLQQKLQASDERFKRMINEAPLGIAIVDSLTAEFQLVNPALARITGRSIEELERIDWVSKYFY